MSTDIVAEPYKLLRHLHATREAVHYALDTRKFLYYLKSVAVRVSVVYHNGNFKSLGKSHLSSEILLLKSLVVSVVVIVKSYLSESDTLAFGIFYILNPSPSISYTSGS